MSEGRLLNEMKNKVSRLGLTDAVQFLGFRDDVHELMQAMDVFVLPSLWEGLPFTLVESQCAGLPSVISDVISDEAIVTDVITKVSLKETADKWADVILEVYRNTKRKDISDQVRDGGFDIVSTARWLQEFYVKRYQDAVENNR